MVEYKNLSVELLAQINIHRVNISLLVKDLPMATREEINEKLCSMRNLVEGYVFSLNNALKDYCFTKKKEDNNGTKNS